MYGVAQTRTRLLGRRTLNPQAAKQVLSECAISTSRQNFATNSAFKPASCCARPGSKVRCETHNFDDRRGVGRDSVMLLRELWNEGEVSIPPLHS